MKDRLLQVMKTKGISANKLGELLDVQPSGISHILSGRNKPSMDFVEKLLTAYPDVSPEWFILGQGAMLRDAKASDKTTNVFTGEQPSSAITAELPFDISKPNISYDKETAASDNTTANNTEQIDSKKQNHKEVPKHIVKVMIFYSDYSVDVFEHIKQ